MSTRSGAGQDTAELMTHKGHIPSFCNRSRQTDADGRIFRSGEFVTGMANNSRPWQWKLLRSGESLYNFSVEPLSDRPVTLNSVELFASNITLTETTNIGQPRYQSGEFSVANSMPDFDKAFTHGNGIDLWIFLLWTETAAAIPMSSDSLLEGLYAKAMDGGETLYELVSSNGQSFCINGAIFEAKSAYFERFFATKGWKEQTDGRMVLPWTSAVVKQLIRYVYLNNVDGDVCELLPDILDAAQMWELVGMTALITAQMKVRLQKAALDADTDTAAEYLKMAHLHSLASLVPVCNGILADNFDKFYESDICKQMDHNETYRHLVQNIFHHKHK